MGIWEILGIPENIFGYPYNYLLGLASLIILILYSANKSKIQNFVKLHSRKGVIILIIILVFCPIYYFSNDVMLFFSKSSEDQFVIAISPFKLIPEKGEPTYSTSIANELKKKLEENEDIELKIIVLDDNSVESVENSVKTAKKSGANIIIYGEINESPSGKNMATYHILPLFDIEYPSNLVELEKHNTIIYPKENAQITIKEYESLETNASTAICYVCGLKNFEQKKFDSAINFFNSVEKNKKDSLILNMIAICYLYTNNLDRSLQCIDEALIIKNTDPVSLLIKGKILSEKGQYEEAAEVYNNSVKYDPDNELTWLDRGMALSNLNKSEEAKKSFKEAINISNKAINSNSNDRKAWAIKGLAFDYLGTHEEAIEAYDKALELNPQDEVSWYNKGTSLRSLGRNEEAINAFNHAIKLNPKDFGSLVNKGNALSDLGRNEEAIKTYEDAISINPQLSVVWFNKGSAFHCLGMYEEAIKCYDIAIQKFEKNKYNKKVTISDIWYNKGLAYFELKKIEDEIKCYDMAIQLYEKTNPYEQIPVLGLYLNKVSCYIQLGMYEKAIETCDEVIKMDSNVASYKESAWMYKGQSLYCLLRHEEAIVAFNKVTELNPGDPEPWKWKGQCLDSLGDFRGSREAFEKAYELDPGLLSWFMKTYGYKYSGNVIVISSNDTL